MAEKLSNVHHQGGMGIEIAIVGGGIIGIMTALGLLHRGMRVTVYERAEHWHEMGVGFAFTGIARECMRRLNPDLLEALRRVGQESHHKYNRYWDGFHPKTKEEAENEDNLLFQVSALDAAYWGCLRSHLLREMATHLPEGVMKFGKKLIGCVDKEGQKVVLGFSDGEDATADLVIGCDGINSTMRKVILGPDEPASYATYSHNVAYRTVVPVAKASSALGQDKASSPCMHLGPDAVIVSYPVNNGTLLNLSIFVYDLEQRTGTDNVTTCGTREVQRALDGWGPHVQDLVKLLPEDLPKWTIFDMAKNPAPTYARGRLCIAGDAAHASSPLLGAGACMGVEDALVLAETLKTALDCSTTSISKPQVISAALKAYSTTRMERSQWLVQASREAGDIYQWRHPEASRDAAKCELEFGKRARPIWDFDVDKMVTDAKRECQNLIQADT